MSACVSNFLSDCLHACLSSFYLCLSVHPSVCPLSICLSVRCLSLCQKNQSKRLLEFVNYPNNKMNEQISSFCMTIKIEDVYSQAFDEYFFPLSVSLFVLYLLSFSICITCETQVLKHCLPPSPKPTRISEQVQSSQIFHLKRPFNFSAAVLFIEKNC